MAQHFKIVPSIPLRLGWIPYFNLLPLKHELERTVGNEVEFHKGHPAQVNRWLSDGKIALAPCSSVCLLKNPNLEIAFPLGIAANGPVHSVYLGFHHDDAGTMLETIKARQALLRDIFRIGLAKYEADARKLAAFVFKMASALPPLAVDIPPPLNVTPASATSTALARVLYRLWFGEAAYEMRAGESSHMLGSQTSSRRPIDLLIGDEALARKSGYRAIFDLGEAWRDLTDLPFVFAVWQSSRQTLSPYWRQRMMEAAELAQARMRVEPCHYFPENPTTDANGKTIDLAAYWKSIQYRLGPQHFKGLALFLALTRHLQPTAATDQAVVNIMRWESFGHAAATRL